MAVRYSSIAAALLGRCSRNHLECHSMGHAKVPSCTRLFVSFCTPAICTFTRGCLGGILRCYRDANGLACDAMVFHPDGRISFIAVQLYGNAGTDFRAACFEGAGSQNVFPRLFNGSHRHGIHCAPTRGWCGRRSDRVPVAVRESRRTG